MPGFKNVMFGGEGLFVTTLTGPGTIWLQGIFYVFWIIHHTLFFHITSLLR